MKIKVCGMRDQKNIAELEKILEVDFMGHIFVNKSPRFIGSKKVKSHLPTFGVFVNSSLDEIKKATVENNLDVIQLHGDESPTFSKSVNETIKPAVKVFSIAEKEDFDSTFEYEGCCTYFLFDTKTQLRGGSGIKFDWSLIYEYNGKTPFFLSGGISLKDVAAIKKIDHPQFYGVDINSGFEVEPGIKNIEQIKLFAKQLKS